MGKIIIVEDEAIVAMENRMNLSSRGHTILAIVASAEEALMAVERTGPDLLIMDIKLRGPMDGITAVAELRRTSGIPVIFLTGSSDLRTRDRLSGLSNIAVLLKPVMRDDLFKEVDKMLSAK